MELADIMKDKLSTIPGVIAEPSQPIQMRFNELMTGIRQDVAIKIFGENLDTPVAYADKVAAVIGPIKGITQPRVERLMAYHKLPLNLTGRKLQVMD